jgi:hypothetical protein
MLEKEQPPAPSYNRTGRSNESTRSFLPCILFEQGRRDLETLLPLMEQEGTRSWIVPSLFTQLFKQRRYCWFLQSQLKSTAENLEPSLWECNHAVSRAKGHLGTLEVRQQAMPSDYDIVSARC